MSDNKRLSFDDIYMDIQTQRALCHSVEGLLLQPSADDDAHDQAVALVMAMRDHIDGFFARLSAEEDSAATDTPEKATEPV